MSFTCSHCYKDDLEANHYFDEDSTSCMHISHGVGVVLSVRIRRENHGTHQISKLHNTLDISL